MDIIKDKGMIPQKKGKKEPHLKDETVSHMRLGRDSLLGLIKEGKGHDGKDITDWEKDLG